MEYYVAVPMSHDEKDVRISDEHIGFEWLGFEPALKRTTFSNARRVLMRAEQKLSSQ